jgi:hypothetical protein
MLYGACTMQQFTELLIFFLHFDLRSAAYDLQKANVHEWCFVYGVWCTFNGVSPESFIFFFYLRAGFSCVSESSITLSNPISESTYMSSKDCFKIQNNSNM